MNWRLWTWKDVVGFVVTIGLFVGVLIYFVVSPPKKPTNCGFGPEWQCTCPGNVDAVCLKKPTNKKPAN